MSKRVQDRFFYVGFLGYFSFGNGSALHCLNT